MRIYYQWPSLNFIWHNELVMYIGWGFWCFLKPLCHIFGYKYSFCIYFGHCRMWGTDKHYIILPYMRKPKLTGDRMYDSYNMLMYAMEKDPKGVMEAINKSSIEIYDDDRE